VPEKPTVPGSGRIVWPAAGHRPPGAYWLPATVHAVPAMRRPVFWILTVLPYPLWIRLPDRVRRAWIAELERRARS